MENIQNHLYWIQKAAKQGADFILFQEMSLTGYTHEKASELKFYVNDYQLTPLIQAAKNNRMVIVVGVPIELEERLYIGSFVIYPNGSVKIYTKKYLHEGEEVYFQSSFDNNPLIEIENEKIALSICYDLEVE